jgi:hypothetical protein
MEGLIWIAIIVFTLTIANNIKLRKELKKKIDFEYEEYRLKNR